MPLDPTVEVMLQQMAEAQGPALNEMSPPEAREMYRTLNAASPKPGVASVEDAKAGGIPIRIYKVNEQGEQPVVVFFHGCRRRALRVDRHSRARRRALHGLRCSGVRSARVH